MRISLRPPLLYILLALLGAGIGPQLASWLSASPPTLVDDRGQNLERAALSPDGRWIAALEKTPQGWRMGVVDTTGGPPIGPFEVPDPPARVRTFAWQQSSRRVAFGCRDQVHVIDTEKRTHIQHQANPMVRQVQFRGDLLLGRADNRVYLWDADKGKQVFQMDAPHLLHADLTADGKILALGCFGEGVRLVSVPSKKVVRHLANGLTPAMLSLCHGDQWLVAALRTGRANEDHAALFEVSSGRQLGSNIVQPRLRGANVTPDGHRLVLRSDRVRRIGFRGRFVRCARDWILPPADHKRPQNGN